MNHRINKEIKAKTIKLIDENSKSLGEMSLEEALKISTEREYDLVEMGAFQKPPVCKLMNYGKFKYQTSKKQQQLKKNQKQIITKEIKLRPQIDEHDLKIKFSRAIEFLEDDYKVKVSVTYYRGRQSGLSERGEGALQTFIQNTALYSEVESEEKHGGRRTAVILSPKRSNKATEHK